MKKYAIPSILLIYCVCALGLFSLWRDANFNGVTGDEPHYLIMANGLAQHGALEQTVPYTEAFLPSGREKFGIPPQSAKFSPENMHTIVGQHGHFNMHNLGLPLLLAMPFAAGGIVGAKLFMMLCGALAVLLCWHVSGVFAANRLHRWLAVCATCIAMPLVPAANQVYPDLLAGVLALLGLYWFSTTQVARGRGAELALAVAVAYLPWLQIKFGPTCAAIVLAVVARIYRDSGDLRRIARILAVAGVSCLLLVTYNFYAYGKLSGPYLADAIEASKTSVMVMLGLLFDQNQGLLMLNPINLVGLLAIGWLYRAQRALALLWSIVFLSLIVPNGLHPNWYGGWCFSGRFGWAGAIVFLMPTLYGLLEIARRKARLFYAMVGLSVLVQGWLFYQYGFRLVSMYNRDATTPFAGYSMLYGPVHAWLPALYDVRWAAGYAPNYAWLGAGAMLLAAGFLRQRHATRVAGPALEGVTA
ncbi:hypothetical protein [Rugamonas apoptosis]|uniref:Glycosyltransferase RgtA/B/C/D-like domain-containing protein n=1 Tax=Rugamonas apoptosis TaxID=2758570 RepID=A0A7W2F603_9BURK|nr:hypothetical protein [Rugamonas apoptosis]MBA5685760.1 hypothetical protein [Rugamonas apoptosis]